MANPAFSPRARQLGAKLRRHREAQGVGVREMARRMEERSHAVVSHWESGNRVPTPEIVDLYARKLDLSAEVREALVAEAHHAGEPNLLAAGIPGVPEVLGTLMECERTARSIVEVPPAKLISGLLQTGDYARAVMGDVQGADARVAMRLARADILTRRDPVRYEVLLGEESLRQPIADPDVMVTQLQHLLAMAERSAVTVQVIPALTPYHEGMMGPFELIEYDEAPPIVHIEHTRASLFLDDDKDVAKYQQDAHQLREEVAMSPEASVELIAKVIKETTQT